MLFRTINSNSIISYALLPVFLIGIWANALFDVSTPALPSDETAMPLWNLIEKLVKNSSFFASTISMLLAAIMAFGVNRIVNRYSLMSTQTPLPGFVYLVLISGFISIQKLHPVWFFTPLFLLALERLFLATGNRKPMALCFEAAFWLSVGSLFYAKGIYFIVLIWITMVILRSLTGRSAVASILGLILPYLLSFGVFFWQDKHLWFLNLTTENFFSGVAFFEHNLFSKIYNGLAYFLILLSILMVFRIMPSLKINSRKHYRIFIWLIVCCTIAGLTPYFSLEVGPLLAIGASIMTSRFLLTMKKSLIQELTFYLLIIITFTAQFLI